ncbi:MAG: GDP-mannose 4,6-dehydratase [Thiohalomonadales bacterium]
MLLQGKNVLITGADGFIGSHLTETLVKLGANTRALISYNHFGSWGWLDHIEKDVLEEIDIYSGDICTFDSVLDAMSGCNIVFHLAALVGVPYSYRSPEAYLNTNIKGTMNVLQAAREIDIEKLIHTSSSEVYGTTRTVPINEGHVTAAQSPYAASKIAADQMALAYYHSFDTPVSIIRPFNTYGPRQTASAIIPTIITQITNDVNSIKLGSTSPTRDFNYIEDTIRGFVAVAESDFSTGEIINIGSGYEISIADTVKYIADLMDKPINIIQEDRRIRPYNSEVERLVADNTKAREMLNWSPHYAGVEGIKRGLRYTINWFSNPSNQKLYKNDVFCV